MRRDDRCLANSSASIASEVAGAEAKARARGVIEVTVGARHLR
jgi:hypothetical protein